MDSYIRSYQPNYFSIKELVSRAMYDKRGDKAIMLINAYVLHSADTLRAYLTDLTPDKPHMAQLICNDWSYGGIRQFSCLRSPDDQHYSSTSQHALGNAIDLVSRYYTADQLRQIILANRELFPYVTCIEMNVNWLHMDCRNLPKSAPEGAIMLVYPDGSFEYV